MPFPVLTPRVNNNDDHVRLLQYFVHAGQQVKSGDLLAEVETEKAVLQIEAEGPGYVLELRAKVEDTIEVGSVLLWMGETADDRVPEESAAPPQPAAGSPAEPTAKARVLIQEHKLDASKIPAKGDRLTVQDVEEYLQTLPAAPAPQAASGGPAASGTRLNLTPGERGMLRSLQWQRDEAVPAYLEIAYDPAPWAAFARQFAEEHRLLLSPLLPLVAYQLAGIAQRSPRINSVIAGEQRHQYADVNVGFTIQAGTVLYLAVVRSVAELSPLAFVRAIGDLQRKALGHKLTASELDGATVAFTSMERWRVTRHIPVLPPYVSLMVAHTIDSEGRGLLGATYDHRLLTGSDAIAVIRGLVTPDKQT